MKLIFDTSILIDIEKNKGETLDKLRELFRLYPSPPELTFISYFEYLYGLKKRSPKNLEDSISFIDSFNVLQTTNKTADILSNLKLKYEKKGMEFSLSDFLSACIAIENDFTLLTKDKDFERIEELKKIII